MKVVPLPGTPAMPQIELRPLDSLVAYHRNARTHSPAQVSQLEALLLEFGWTNAILVDDMGIVAGHGRSMAAANLYKRGVQIRFPNGAPIPLGQVPVIDCTGWSPSQRRAYILADNASALKAGWDEDLLRLELQELEADGFDLSLTAFEEDELDALLAPLPEEPEGSGDPDDVPEPPEDPVSTIGDVWICGPHRIACGDCADQSVIDALMQGELADLCATDPPYNVSYESKLAGKIKNDDMGDAEFRRMLQGWYTTMFHAMKPGAPIYVAHADKEAHAFRLAFESVGFKFSSMLIWRKNSLVLSRGDYHSQHEPILYGWKPGARHRWYGGRKLTSIVEYGNTGPARQLEDGRWAITVGDSVLIVDGQASIQEAPGSVIYHDKPSRSELHPTTKPVGLWEKLMKPSSRPGDIVIDWFSGSGTTLIAADRMGLIARVCELDPKFVDVAVRRWEHLTGRRAIHAVTGLPFPCEGEERTTPAADDGTIPETDLF